MCGITGFSDFFLSGSLVQKNSLFRRCPATGVVRPMAFQGLEAKRDALKHRCPATAYSAECAVRDQWSEAAGVAPDGFGRSLRVHLHGSDRRIFTPLPCSSPTWGRRSALQRNSLWMRLG